MQPTQEQHDIVLAVNTRENLLVSALAGTGKTTTLRLIAEAYPDRKVLYLAYNKNMQLDARKIFPAHVRPSVKRSTIWGHLRKTHI